MSKYEGGPAEKPSFHAALREIFMTFVTLSSKYALKNHGKPERSQTFQMLG